MSRKNWLRRCYRCWRTGKTSHAMHDTFRELHQQIRCNADEQAAQAVLELAQ